jgi:putative endonuclease
MNTYYVYIMANKSRTLYVGVTNNLEHRVWQHKTKANAGFTARYNINRLVLYDTFANVLEAIAAEKKIKGWLRIKKVRLVEEANPYWKDLAADWFTDFPKTACHPERSEGPPVISGESHGRSFGVPQDDSARVPREH